VLMDVSPLPQDWTPDESLWKKKPE
jgi:hypothetical protein